MIELEINFPTHLVRLHVNGWPAFTKIYNDATLGEPGNLVMTGLDGHRHVFNCREITNISAKEVTNP